MAQGHQRENQYLQIDEQCGLEACLAGQLTVGNGALQLTLDSAVMTLGSS
jgi:hypothetical protein